MPNSGIPSALISEDDLFEYAFIGDITDVIPTYIFSSPIFLTMISQIQIILTDHVDIQHNPCIVASGSVTDFDSSNFTFSLNPSQYINLPHSSLDCHLFCFFDSESKKWKNKKPMPTTGSTISITGFLTRVKRGFNQNRTLHIELDNIAYLSRTSSSGPSASLSQRLFLFTLHECFPIFFLPF
jgi:hypothetical protein